MIFLLYWICDSLIVGTPYTLDAHFERGLNQRVGALRESRRIQAALQPIPSLSPRDVIDATLFTLQDNNIPEPDSGTKLLCRFFTDRWRHELIKAIGPNADDPAVLSDFLARDNLQWNLLLTPYFFTFPSDLLMMDAHHAFQQVDIFVDDECSERLASLGWEFVRGDETSGCWLLDRLHWHDFRDEFSPGFGEEEWTRICG